MAKRKLTDDQVREIRAIGKVRREMTNKRLAARFGVNKNVIDSVLARARYRDVP